MHACHSLGSKKAFIGHNPDKLEHSCPVLVPYVPFKKGRPKKKNAIFKVPKRLIVNSQCLTISRVSTCYIPLISTKQVISINCQLSVTMSNKVSNCFFWTPISYPLFIAQVIGFHGNNHIIADLNYPQVCNVAMTLYWVSYAACPSSALESQHSASPMPRKRVSPDRRRRKVRKNLGWGQTHDKILCLS